MHLPDLQSLTLEGWTVLSSVGYPFSSFLGGHLGKMYFLAQLHLPLAISFQVFWVSFFCLLHSVFLE